MAVTGVTAGNLAYQGAIRVLAERAHRARGPRPRGIPRGLHAFRAGARNFLRSAHSRSEVPALVAKYMVRAILGSHRIGVAAMTFLATLANLGETLTHDITIDTAELGGEPFAQSSRTGGFEFVHQV